MSLPYKKILVVGATSGIGQALAARLIRDGHNVIACGRRKDRLEALLQEHGPEKLSTIVFDIAKIHAVPEFAADVTADHPDLDCVFLNAGMQRRCDFSVPEDVSMGLIEEEFTTNYLSYLALTKAFLPFLQKKEESALIFTTSGLALVPITRCANYCASKAALHHWILCLREQLKGSKVRIIEILPPAVQTELHDPHNQPDIQNGRLIGMPLDQFTNGAYDGLVQGLEQIPVGSSKQSFDSFERTRQDLFASRMQMMK